jgi:hypothetical protein
MKEPHRCKCRIELSSESFLLQPIYTPVLPSAIASEPNKTCTDTHFQLLSPSQYNLLEVVTPSVAFAWSL